MQLHNSSDINNDNDCIFCQQNGQGLTLMMNQALTAKHSTNQSEGLIYYIDVLMRIEQPCNAEEAWAVYHYKQSQACDERDEFLKRQYGIIEFQGKIKMLTQYYKFHSDVPRVVELGIQKILGKYYDKKREQDYKKVKKILKEEQGLSITSVQESQSSIDGTKYEKKSRYSTLLEGLDESKRSEDNVMSDSKILNDMCKAIEKALPTSKLDKKFQIKGSFTSMNNHKFFEEYLKEEQRRVKQKLKKNNENHFPRSRFNLQQLLNRRQKNEKAKEKQPQKQKQKQTFFRDSREFKKKEKDNKFIYNTNIKIQIKNAMFYSQGQNQPSQMGSIQNESKQQNRFRKKNPIYQQDYLNHQSNKKIIAEIYKSTRQDLKKRMQNSSNQQQRLITKESINKSQSKDKKKSLSKPTTTMQSTKDLKKHVSGSTSARRLLNNNQFILSNNKVPLRSTSASNIKKRSYSNNTGTTPASASSLPRKTFEKRPIESISKYRSSDIRQKMESISEQQRQSRAIYIKEILNKKLTFKHQ